MNDLTQIVTESGLVKAKADVILQTFQHYFAMAGEWEAKAKTIVVTNGNQKMAIKQAREGRLFLREKRIAIEKTRKELKEQSLREGKAIDGIANVLKSVIIPIEEYLERQEKFVEIQLAKITEEKLLAERKRMEDERIAKEKAEAAERERIKAENEKLRKEAEEREKLIEENQKKAIQDALKLELQQKEFEKQRQELENAETLRKELKAKLEAELKSAEEKLTTLASQIDMVTCPFCGKTFSLTQNNHKEN